MGRRVHFVKPKSDKIRKEALAEMRKVRASIDPEVLAHARQIIEDMAEREQQQKAQVNPQEQTASDKDLIPCDKKKTVDTVKKFLELKADSQTFSKKLQALFVDNKTL